MTDAAPYTVPKEPGRWRALTLAAIVHAALFAFLWFGVRWQNQTPVGVEAEVWGPQVKEAAPRPEPEPPQVKPEPQKPVKEIPKPREVEAPVAKPDIALEKRKQEQRKLHEQEEEKARQAAKEKADAAKHAAEDKKRKLTEAEAKAAEQRRKENLQRLASQAGGSGDASQTQGPRADAGYTNRLIAVIKSHTVFVVPPGLEGNPAVEYTVELFPDGSVRNIRKLRSSRLPGFDEAVERAIKLSEPYPPNKSGTVPSSFTFSHKPKDNE